MNEFSSKNPSSSHRIVLFLICFIFISFFIWAYVSQIEQHVRAFGRIIPAGQSKVIQNLEGGIIESLMVSEGQTVEKNGVLMQISNQRAQSDMEEVRIALSGKMVRLTRLRAESAGAESFTYVPGEGEIVPADIIENETQFFQSRRNTLREKISVFQEQINQKQLKLDDTRSQLENLASERDIAQDQLNINERLRRSGAISESRYLDSKSRVINYDTRLEQLRKSMPITQAEEEEIRNRIKGEQQGFQSEVADEINQTELEIRQLQERLKARSDEVDRTALVSPVKGIVNKVFITTVGGVIKPGEPLIEIIPIDEDLIVEAQVAAKDRGLIWIGLPVMVKVTAYDFAVYGGMQGTLTEISADSFKDDRGNIFYRVRVSLKDKTLRDKPVYPGMTVTADIISGETSVLHALLKPFWRIQETALREPG